MLASRCSTPKFQVTSQPVVNSPQASAIRSVAAYDGAGTQGADGSPRQRLSDACPVLSLQHEKSSPNNSGSSSEPSTSTTPRVTSPRNHSESASLSKTKTVSFDVVDDAEAAERRSSCEVLSSAVQTPALPVPPAGRSNTRE